MSYNINESKFMVLYVWYRRMYIHTYSLYISFVTTVFGLLYRMYVYIYIYDHTYIYIYMLLWYIALYDVI